MVAHTLDLNTCKAEADGSLWIRDSSVYRVPGWLGLPLRETLSRETNKRKKEANQPEVAIPGAAENRKKENEEVLGFS